jgi:hypothetical protein
VGSGQTRRFVETRPSLLQKVRDKIVEPFSEKAGNVEDDFLLHTGINDPENIELAIILIRQRLAQQVVPGEVL